MDTASSLTGSGHAASQKSVPPWVDEWLREVAPSAALRRWFGHEPARWAEFKRRYFQELRAEPAATAIAHLRTPGARRRMTLLYAAQDEVHNNAVALREHLGPLRRGKRRAARDGNVCR